MSRGYLSREAAMQCLSWATQQQSSLTQMAFHKGWLNAAQVQELHGLLQQISRSQSGRLASVAPASGDGPISSDSVATVAGQNPLLGTRPDAHSTDSIGTVLGSQNPLLAASGSSDRASSGFHPKAGSAGMPKAASGERPLSSSTGGIQLPEIGSSLDGYEIIRLLGKGGMGAVFVARKDDVDYALKVIITEDESALARFEREAQAVAKVDRHPNIVKIHHFKRGGHLPYLVLDLIDGHGLEDDLKPGECMDFGAATSLIIKLADALNYVHNQGILHRDIKPANVLIRGQDGEPLITDFGLAKGKDSEALTRTTDFIGTPHYMSPEQAGSEHDKVGPTTDIWALGAMLYEMTTGERPFPGQTIMQIVRNILMKEPIAPRKHNPEISEDLETVILKTLSKESLFRYKSASAFADDLRRIQDGEPILGRRVGRLTLWKGRVQRRYGKAGLILLSMALVLFLAVPVVIGGGYFYLKNQAEHCSKNLEISFQKLKYDVDKIWGASLQTVARNAVRCDPGASEDLEAIDLEGLESAQEGFVRDQKLADSFQIPSLIRQIPEAERSLIIEKYRFLSKISQATRRGEGNFRAVYSSSQTEQDYGLRALTNAYLLLVSQKRQEQLSQAVVSPIIKPLLKRLKIRITKPDGQAPQLFTAGDLKFPDKQLADTQRLLASILLWRSGELQLVRQLFEKQVSARLFVKELSKPYRRCLEALLTRHFFEQTQGRKSWPRDLVKAYAALEVGSREALFKELNEHLLKELEELKNRALGVVAAGQVRPEAHEIKGAQETLLQLSNIILEAAEQVSFSDKHEVGPLLDFVKKSHRPLGEYFAGFVDKLEDPREFLSFRHGRGHFTFLQLEDLNAEIPRDFQSDSLLTFALKLLTQVSSSITESFTKRKTIRALQFLLDLAIQSYKLGFHPTFIGNEMFDIFVQYKVFSVWVGRAPKDPYRRFWRGMSNPRKAQFKHLDLNNDQLKKQIYDRALLCKNDMDYVLKHKDMPKIIRSQALVTRCELIRVLSKSQQEYRFVFKYQDAVRDFEEALKLHHPRPDKIRLAILGWRLKELTHEQVEAELKVIESLGKDRFERSFKKDEKPQWYWLSYKRPKACPLTPMTYKEYDRLRADVAAIRAAMANDLKDYKGAIELAKKALEFTDSNRNAQLQLNYAYAKLGMFEEAYEYWLYIERVQRDTLYITNWQSRPGEFYTIMKKYSKTLKKKKSD